MQVNLEEVSKAPQAGMRLHVLASGSRGNAAIVEDAGTGRAVLIDCGICKRDFFDGCAEVGVDPAHIESVLITHEHTDHTKGIGVVLRGLAKMELHPAVYVSSAVYGNSRDLQEGAKDCDVVHFNAGAALSLAGMMVHPFATSHDAAESFGFRVEHINGDVLGYLTDSGIVTPEAFEGLQDCRIMALESNHDVRMLETGPYPYPVKKRVASDRGHLSNDQSAETLQSLLSAKLEQVVAMHISENNNTYRLPQDSLSEVISRNSHPARVQAAFQKRIVTIS